ncbi:MAG: DNA primase [Eubacteriales bacterium]|nr:DNA primase [Eubacteriales bacterium]
MSSAGNNRPIPDELVEEIKAKNDIVAVVEQYVRLDKRSGSNYFGLCPFHNEDTPSFSVAPNKQIFYCFGCHKGGNVIQFVRELEKCTWPQALKILADRASIKLPESDDEAYREKLEFNSRISTLYLEAARYYYRQLTGPAGQNARAYLKNRAISDSTAKKFGLGFAPDEWDGLVKHFAQLNITDPVLLDKSGLCKRGNKGGYYDIFRNRLMFPIFDAMGKIVAFGGRNLDQALPKYMNSPETPIYTKGRHLYGLNIAKSSNEKRLILVEGYMDTIAMHQAGVDYAVAALGTAMTEAQANLLRKYTENVIVCFDADAAGQTAALKSLDILTSRGLKVLVLQMPDGKDPDEFIKKHGAERFRALVDQALPVIDFKIEVARRTSTHQDQFNILSFQDLACTILAQEDNAIVRELYAGKIGTMIHTSAESVMREIDRRRTVQPTNKTDTLHQQLSDRLNHTDLDAQTNSQTANDLAIREEIYFLSLLADQPSLLALLKDQPGIDDFSPGAMQQVAGRVFKLLSEQKAFDTSILMNCAEALMVNERMLSDLFATASLKLEGNFSGQEPANTATELLREMRLNHLRRQLREAQALAEDLSQPEKAALARQRLLDLNLHIKQLRQR